MRKFMTEFFIVVFFLVCSSVDAMPQNEIERAEDLLVARLRTHHLVMIPELDRELELTTDQAEECFEKLELVIFGSNARETIEDHDEGALFKIKMEFFDSICYRTN